MAKRSRTENEESSGDLLSYIEGNKILFRALTAAREISENNLEFSPQMLKQHPFDIYVRLENEFFHIFKRYFPELTVYKTSQLYNTLLHSDPSSPIFTESLSKLSSIMECDKSTIMIKINKMKNTSIMDFACSVDLEPFQDEGEDHDYDNYHPHFDLNIFEKELRVLFQDLLEEFGNRSDLLDWEIGFDDKKIELRFTARM